jgi:hypothetical protein
MAQGGVPWHAALPVLSPIDACLPPPAPGGGPPPASRERAWPLCRRTKAMKEQGGAGGGRDIWGEDLGGGTRLLHLSPPRAPRSPPRSSEPAGPGRESGRAAQQHDRVVDDARRGRRGSASWRRHAERGRARAGGISSPHPRLATSLTRDRREREREVCDHGPRFETA